MLILPGEPAAGQEVFGSASPVACTVCHSMDGTAGIGPSLQGIATRAAARVSGVSAEGYIRQSILDPTAFLVEGFAPVMPVDFGENLSSQQIDDLVDFLLTLK